MTSLEITTGIGCRVNCRYCPQGILLRRYPDKDHQDRLLSLDRFKLICDKLPASVEIRFAGFCEPWLNPACTDMVLYASTTGHPIGVYTTLVGMNPLDVERLADVPFTTFNVHLPSQEGTERIPVTAEYLDTVRSLIASNIPCSFHCHGRTLSSNLSSLSITVTFAPTITRAGNIGSAFDDADMGQPRRLLGRLACGRLTHNVLLPNGDVVLCCMDYGMRHVLGNLLSANYEDIRHGPEMKRVVAGLNEETSDTLCRHCDLFVENVGLRSIINNSVLPAIQRMFVRPKRVEPSGKRTGIP